MRKGGLGEVGMDAVERGGTAALEETRQIVGLLLADGAGRRRRVEEGLEGAGAGRHIRPPPVVVSDDGGSAGGAVVGMPKPCEILAICVACLETRRTAEGLGGGHDVGRTREYRSVEAGNVECRCIYCWDMDIRRQKTVR